MTTMNLSPYVDPLRPSVREQVSRARRMLLRDGLDYKIQARNGGGRWMNLMRPVIESAHRERDHDRPGPSDLDDPAALDAWRNQWKYEMVTGRLDLTVLYFYGSHGDYQLGAYCLGIADPPVYYVRDSRMVTAWADYSPGRWLESEVIDRLRAAGYRTLDWGDGYEHALIPLASAGG